MAFVVLVVYPASHSRPMIEICNPHLGDLRPVFERDFQGMVVEPVTENLMMKARQPRAPKLRYCRPESFSPDLLV